MLRYLACVIRNKSTRACLDVFFLVLRQNGDRRAGALLLQKKNWLRRAQLQAWCNVLRKKWLSSSLSHCVLPSNPYGKQRAVVRFFFFFSRFSLVRYIAVLQPRFEVTWELTSVSGCIYGELTGPLCCAAEFPPQGRFCAAFAAPNASFVIFFFSLFCCANSMLAHFRNRGQLFICRCSPVPVLHRKQP